MLGLFGVCPLDPGRDGEGVAQPILPLALPLHRQSVDREHVVDQRFARPVDADAAPKRLVEEQIIAAAGEPHPRIEAQVERAEPRQVEHHIVRRREIQLLAFAIALAVVELAATKPVVDRPLEHRLDRAIDAVRARRRTGAQHRVQPAIHRPLVIVEEAEQFGRRRRAVHRPVACDGNALLRLDHVMQVIFGVIGMGHHRIAAAAACVIVDHDDA